MDTCKFDGSDYDCVHSVIGHGCHVASECIPVTGMTASCTQCYCSYEHEPTYPAMCLQDEDCNDQDTCTTDTCYKSHEDGSTLLNFCINTPIGDGCHAAGDCPPRSGMTVSCQSCHCRYENTTPEPECTTVMDCTPRRGYQEYCIGGMCIYRASSGGLHPHQLRRRE